MLQPRQHALGVQMLPVLLPVPGHDPGFQHSGHPSRVDALARGDTICFLILGEYQISVPLQIQIRYKVITGDRELMDDAVGNDLLGDIDHREDSGYVTAVRG